MVVVGEGWRERQETPMAGPAGEGRAVAEEPGKKSRPSVRQSADAASVGKPCGECGEGSVLKGGADKAAAWAKAKGGKQEK